jgi:cytochrome oxidase Cu insertion factor (SCO1/SenC/PrrC family)
MKQQIIIIAFAVLSLCYLSSKAQNTARVYKANKTIGIEINIDSREWKEGGAIRYSPVEHIGRREWQYEKPSQDGITGRCSIYSEEPVYINITDLVKDKRYGTWLAEPGDKIVIRSNGKGLSFSGEGAAKFMLSYLIDSIYASVPRPSNRRDYVTYSIEDYLEWNKYLDLLLAKIVPLIDSYKNRLTPYAYHLIRAWYIDQNIDNRGDKFASLRAYIKKEGMSSQRLCDMYDSVYRPGTAKWFEYTSAHIYGNWGPVTYSIYRKYGFDRSKEPLSSPLMFNLMLFDSLSNIYHGLAREKFMLDFFPENFMKEIGFVPETEKLLASYYATPGYPEYKMYMRQLELQARERINGYRAPDFALPDSKGKLVGKKDLTGKIVVMDFWFTGCVGCVQMTPAMRRVEENFRNDTNVVFLGISVDRDKDKWLKSVAQQKYTTGSGIQLYTEGQGEDHAMIRQYAISGYPSFWIMDQQGRIIRTYPHPDPRKDNGKGLTELIHKYLAYPKDGPYVLSDNQHRDTAYYVDGHSLSVKQLASTGNDKLQVQTDIGKTFDVFLKKTLNIEQAEFSRPEKLLALSDIEGNFDAFRKLLQANHVIDENFNWTFGAGHLVFGGDMFDRGNQVTECLWLLYSLEEKAKAAGGYVHFILGNHEIMNMQGDHRYVVKKYKDNAEAIGITLTELYGKRSELGKWLRTKNIVERIGDILFLHGGMSPQVDSLQLTIQEMNRLARPFYAGNIDSSDKRIVKLFDGKLSPFWFRGYYGDIDNLKEIPTLQQVDYTLTRLGVRYIVTGHTAADTLSTRYDKKVINTDTWHANGKSEALLVEGNRFYRVNAEGKKVLLFIDENPIGTMR